MSENTFKVWTLAKSWPLGQNVRDSFGGYRLKFIQYEW